MKKLKLNKETISSLDNNNMKQVEGGAATLVSGNCASNLLCPHETNKCSNPNRCTFYAVSVCCPQHQ